MTLSEYVELVAKSVAFSALTTIALVAFVIALS